MCEKTARVTLVHNSIQRLDRCINKVFSVGIFVHNSTLDYMIFYNKQAKSVDMVYIAYIYICIYIYIIIMSIFVIICMPTVVCYMPPLNITNKWIIIIRYHKPPCTLCSNKNTTNYSTEFGAFCCISSLDLSFFGQPTWLHETARGMISSEAKCS